MKTFRAHSCGHIAMVALLTACLSQGTLRSEEPRRPGREAHARAISFASVAASGNCWSQSLRLAELFPPAALSPDGRTLATSGSKRGEIALWEIDAGRLVRILPGHPESRDHTPYSLTFSPDGSRLASAASHDDAFVWNTQTGEKFLVLSRGVPEDRRGYDYAAPVAFSPDGNSIALALFDLNVRICDAETGKTIRTLETPRIPFMDAREFTIAALRFTPDQKHLVAVGEHEQILRWDLESGTANVISRGSEGLAAFTISDDAGMIAAAHSEFVRIRDASTGKEIRRIERTACGKCELSNVAFTPDGSAVAIATEDDWPVIDLYEIETGTKLESFRGTVTVPHEIRFSQDGERIAAGSLYHVNVWRRSPGAK